MSQQEDDLRALAKIMDFLRAVSIILVVMNVYWFCYEAIRLWGVDIGVVDRILMNFNRTAARIDFVFCFLTSQVGISSKLET